MVPIIAPGFDAETTALTVRLTQIMLLSPVFIGMGAVVSGLLQTYGSFGPTSIAPLVYNLAIIVAAVFLAPVWGIEALAIGVVIGSIVHLVIQLPALRRLDPPWRPRIDLRHPGVRRVSILMGPRLLGLAAGQINLIVSTALACNLVAGSVTAYNYAFQLSQLPVGILGVTIAVALFPTLSRDAALGRASEIRRQLNSSLRVLVFLAAPLTAMMIVLREPIASVFFEYGLFSAESAQRTASALAWFAIGLPAHVVVHVLTRAFYAMQDTRTPVAWAVVAVIVNVVLMLVLVGADGRRGAGPRHLDQRHARGHRSADRPARPARRAGRAPAHDFVRPLRRCHGRGLGRDAGDLPGPHRSHARPRGPEPRPAGHAPGPRRSGGIRLPRHRADPSGPGAGRAAPPVATAGPRVTFRTAVDADRDAWQTLVGAQPSGDFLHDWAWEAVAAFDGQPQRRFLVEEAGSRWPSSPPRSDAWAWGGASGTSRTAR